MSISAGGHARFAEGHRPRLHRGAGGDVAADLGIAGGLPGAEDPYRRLRAIPRHVGPGDDDRAAAIGDHAAFEQVQRVRDHARIHHVVDGGLADVEELEVVHGLHGLGVAHRVMARRGGDLGELFAGRAELEHVPPGGHRVVRDERHAGEGFEVVRRIHAAAPAAGADAGDVAVRGGAVGQERDAGLAFADRTPGVGRVELVGAAAHRGRVDDVRPDAEVLGDGEPARAALRRVVDGIHVAPGQPGVPEGRGGRAGLDVHRGDLALDVPGRVFMDADDGGVPSLCCHPASSYSTLPEPPTIRGQRPDVRSVVAPAPARQAPAPSPRHPSVSRRTRSSAQRRRR